MRLFEIVLVCLLFTVFFLSYKKANINYFRGLYFITLLALILHIMTEGARWQLSLTYITVILSATLCFKQNKLLKKLSLGIFILLVAVSTLTSLFFPIFRFEEPTGPHGIGTVTYHLIDTSRREVFTPNPNDKREIMIQVWYPSEKNKKGVFAPYIQNHYGVAAAICELLGFPKFLFAHLKYVKSYAIENVEMDEAKKTYPVLVYHSGLYGSRHFNNFQVQELVSQGYVVVGIDNPGAVAIVGFPGGRRIKSLPKNEMQQLIDQSIADLPVVPKINGVAEKEGIIPYFAQDLSFVIDRIEKINKNDSLKILTNRLDTDRIGVFGVSLGGIVVAEAAAKDKRIKACLIMESAMPKYVMENGLAIPTMIMMRDIETMRLEREKSGGWTEKDIEQHLFTTKDVYKRLQNNGYYIQIPEMFHVDFTDVPLWVPYGRHVGLTGKLKSKKIHQIINTFSINFFNKELEGVSSEFLENPSQRFDNVIYKYK